MKINNTRFGFNLNSKRVFTFPTIRLLSFGFGLDLLQLLYSFFDPGLEKRVGRHFCKRLPNH